MRSLYITVFIIIASVLTPALSTAQTDQTAAARPPLSQPLVREGTLAMRLAAVFKVGAPADEIEAESALSDAGISPRNGWIADYPVTPDIVDELQTAVGEAAEAGKIALDKEAAMKTFQDIINENDLSVRADNSGQNAGDTSAPDYPDSTDMNNYYYDEGPPVVTYYAPPPDYAYLYSWVPYPFWWSDFWFPGFFVLVDFDVRVHRHAHDHGHRDGGHFSNHFRDPRTGRMSRIDPANRSHGGTSPNRAGAVGARPPVKSGGQAILNTSRGRAATGAYRGFRGYGASGAPTGTRSSAFDRSPNSQFERNSSDRGFQSRSNAGLTPSAGRGSAGGPRGGGGIGFHGGGGGMRR